MATARIRFQWPDGDELVCEVRVSESYPDAVAEAKAQALAMYASALGVTLAASTDNKDGS